MTNNQAFRLGVIKGIRLFAYWRDGRQYVGSTGETLKEALSEFKKGTYDCTLDLPEQMYEDVAEERISQLGVDTDYPHESQDNGF